MSTTSTATPKLLEIPVELFNDIADRADTIPLRLTCRQAAQQAEDAFIQKYFIHRRHAITRQSLEALVYIAKHPRLRRRLESIELVYVSADVWLAVEQIFGFKFMTEMLPGRQGANFFIGHATMRRQDFDLVTLSTALRSLKAANVVPELQVSNFDEKKHIGLYGKTRLAFLPAVDDEVRCGSGLDAANALLFKALITTKFPVTHLSFATDSANELLRDTGLAAVFSNLVSLNMTLSWATFISAGPFVAVMQSAKALKNISINLGIGKRSRAEVHGPVKTVILDSFRGATLRSLELTMSYFMGDNLQAFFRAHKASLVKVKLSRVGISRNGKWTSIFEDLLEAPNLQNISVDGIWRSGAKSRVCQGADDGQGVKTLLGRLIREQAAIEENDEE